MTELEALVRAKALAASNVLFEFAPQTEVTLMRVIIYTGTYEAVKEQLKASLGVGPHNQGKVKMMIYNDRYEAVNAK